MGTLRWTDGRGVEQTREINHTIDIREFKGRAGYPLLLVAANWRLSVRVLEMLLEDEGGKNERGRNWVFRRRWMFADQTTNSESQSNPDGKDARAVAIMRENSTFSLRNLSRLLAEQGIKRGKDWVRRHRCD
jgi:hypothetical protein